PALAEARPLEGNVEQASHRAVGTVASHEVVALDFQTPAVGPAYANRHRTAVLAVLVESLERVLEPRLNVRKPGEPCAKHSLEHLLVERASARIAVRRPGGVDAGETAPGRGEISVTVARNNDGEDFLHESRRLHGAQRLVVDGHRPGFVDRGGITLDQEGLDALGAE